MPRRDPEARRAYNVEYWARRKATETEVEKQRKAEYHVQWYQENKERLAEYNDQASVRERKSVVARARRHGISVEQYENMLASQNNCCAICKADFDLSYDGSRLLTPHVDHDHLTGQVRALLCQLCNLGLGKFKDNPEVMRAAIEYVQMHHLLDICT